MPNPKKAVSSATTPMDDRELAHPHRTDQEMSTVLPAAISEPESSAFGLTAIGGPTETDAGADLAFDRDDGAGVGLVKRSYSEIMVRRLPELEPEMVDSAVLKDTYVETNESDEDEGDETHDGFGFVFIDDRDQDRAPPNAGEEEEKGAAVFKAE